MREQDSKLKMAPRAGMPVVNISNGLDWQTGARGSFDPQRFSGALANHHRRCRTPKRQNRGTREMPEPGRDLAQNQIYVLPQNQATLTQAVRPNETNATEPGHNA